MSRGDLVAFTGGGGKTTAILRLSRELRARGWRVLASTTTKVGATLASEFHVVLADAGEARAAVEEVLDRVGAAFLASGHAPDGKLAGVRPDLLDALAASRVADVVLVEADGSRQRPVKAPAPHEPVVPARASVVSFMVGADAIGAPVDGPLVHRPELVRAFGSGPDVSPALLTRLVTSERGGLKGVPQGASARPILNRISLSDPQEAAAAAAEILRGARDAFDRVLLTDLLDGLFLVAARAESGSRGD